MNKNYVYTFNFKTIKMTKTQQFTINLITIN